MARFGGGWGWWLPFFFSIHPDVVKTEHAGKCQWQNQSFSLVVIKKKIFFKNYKTAVEYNMKIKDGILYEESQFKILLREKMKRKHPASKSVLDKTV